jgi:iron(III) transport system substrate-binding protein
MLLVAGLCTTTDAEEVVVYTSLDQVFSEPVLTDFERDTGINVRAVYDVEASKTTGLVNRLIAEKDRPKCDVFWNSEVGRTIVLKQKGILAPYRSPSAEDIPPVFRDKEDYWTGFAARARVLVYNSNVLNEQDLPESIFELTQPKWKGKVALAYPLFGTTATHVAALYVHLGKKEAEEYLRDLKANNVVVVDGNSVSRDLVVEGRLPLGFTDTDDVNVALQSGKPVGMIYPDKNGIGTFLIPNTIALVKNAPHPEQGKKLIDYLLSKEVESKLAFCESAQMPLRDDVKKPGHVPKYSSIKAMAVDFYKVAEKMDEAAKFCQSLFMR